MRSVLDGRNSIPAIVDNRTKRHGRGLFAGYNKHLSVWRVSSAGNAHLSADQHKAPMSDICDNGRQLKDSISVYNNMVGAFRFTVGSSLAGALIFFQA
jgi:hypothetical protein